MTTPTLTLTITVPLPRADYDRLVAYLDVDRLVSEVRADAEVLMATRLRDLAASLPEAVPYPDDDDDEPAPECEDDAPDSCPCPDCSAARRGR